MTGRMALGELVRPAGERAGLGTTLPVFSVTKHRGFVRSEEYFNKRVFSKDLSSYKVVEPGHFAYATIHLDEGSIGIAPEAGLISPMYTVFAIDRQVVDPLFLIRYLKSPRALATYAHLGNGTAERRRSISLAALGRLPIDLPPLEEQRRIAAILDQADELRAKRRRTLALLDELRAEVLVSVGHRKQVPLAEHLAFLTSGSRGWARYYSNGGTPFLRIQNVGKDKLSAADLVRVDAPSSAEADRTRVQVGDVLLSITADLGRSAVVTPELAGANVSQHLALLRLKGIAPRYVSAYLSSPTGLRQLMKMNRGATKQGLNFDDVRSILIPQLAEEEQAEVVRQLEAIDESASRADAHLAHLDELFASLQHRAFTRQL